MQKHQAHRHGDGVFGFFATLTAALEKLKFLTRIVSKCTLLQDKTLTNHEVKREIPWCIEVGLSHLRSK